jgi:hypothetical protein
MVVIFSEWEEVDVGEAVDNRSELLYPLCRKAPRESAVSLPTGFDFDFREMTWLLEVLKQ